MPEEWLYGGRLRFVPGTSRVQTRRYWPELARGQWLLTFTWTREVPDRRARCIGLAVEWAAPPEGAPGTAGEPEEVNSVLLRSLPVAQLLEEENELLVRMSADAVMVQRHYDAGGAYGDRLPDSDPALLDKVRAIWGRPAGGAGRRPAYDVDFYAKVAQVYREAWASRRNPTTAVAESRELGGPRSTSSAAKLVARARRMGLLGPTRKGQAGGVIPFPASHPEDSK